MPLKENQVKEILTVSEVARLLQISQSSVYKYAEKSVIPSFKVGSNLRFLENEIDDYIKKTIYSQRNKNEKLWGF
jgi:excisionase family DNA binding protein